jgi:predicted nucleotidyltransferase
MTTEGAIDPVIARFRAALAELYGARGDAGPESDYDFAIFLRDAGSLWEKSGRLAEIETDILLDTGAVINALPFPAGEYDARTPLMHERDSA